MFSENEIATLIEIEEVEKVTSAAKKRFVEEEVSLLDISHHDFLALIMMTPAVGVALANGSISLFEELALNKIARKMSKGGYFMKMDPVVHAMKFFIKSFEKWEPVFYEVIDICIESTIDRQALNKMRSMDLGDPIKTFARDLMSVPYIFVRFMNTMVLNDEADIVDQRSISAVEFDKIKDIGTKLKIHNVPVFRSFCNTFEVK